MQGFLGVAVIWTGIWLIEGVLNLVGAIRIADELPSSSGATGLIGFWSGYWWMFLASRSVLWGVPIIMCLPVASLWHSAVQLRLSHGSRPIGFESATVPSRSLQSPVFN
jgi:hypothetical protein